MKKKKRKVPKHITWNATPAIKRMLLLLRLRKEEKRLSSHLNTKRTKRANLALITPSCAAVFLFAAL